MKLKEGSLKGETAVVTGASSGIGLEFSRHLARAGADVVMISNDGAPLRSHALELAREYGVATFPMEIDLTGHEAPSEIIAILDQKGLSPIILINNAGIFDFRQVSDLSPRRIDMYIDLHLRSVTRLSSLMAGRMAQREIREGHRYRGYILNMSSMSCWMPMPGIAMYAATKAYIRVFSRALRIELKPSGISVTVACPGGIATDLFGLPRNLQKLGVRVGALATPERFTRNALDRAFSGKPQYINGPVNRLAIFFCSLTPEYVRGLVKSRLLDKMGNRQ